MRLSRRTLLHVSILSPLAAADGVGIDTAKTIGSNSAPITFELFSDFQCPACQRFHAEAIRPMIDDYVHRGKVYLAWRDFPLPMHAFARKAAYLAAAAAHIGKFEAVSNLLYDKQAAWSTSGDIAAVLKQFLPPAEFGKVMELAKTPAILDSVERDVQAGYRQGVNQTPTSVVTRRIRSFPIRGSVSYGILRRFLDEQLAS